ncbi:hypothetical protein MBRA_23980 [Mycobacterium branderi]|uniref:Secreted protein n=2 Tax=Mycobacterium branderi TaxID=43348 RepID=A0ABM7KMG7_9MYCO|nr:hypothetical protein MBRA_23980 [Mycobacterium branderi]
MLWNNPLENREFGFHTCETHRMRSIVAAVAALVAAGGVAAAPAVADPTTSCDDPSCVPGIQPGVVLGALCENTTYYVFGVTAFAPGGSDGPNRIVFCGSPRRYAPRWFRSPSLVGIKELGADCTPYLNMVAQAPDGLFLTCMAQNGRTVWVRGDT